LLSGSRVLLASCAGDKGRIGGVPKRGGLLPNDSLSAEDSADSPGAGSDERASPRPASGVWSSDGSSLASCAGVGIWRTEGEAVGKDGTGEPRRAVIWSRAIEADGELRSEPRGEGTGRGCVSADEGLGSSSVCAIFDVLLSERRRIVYGDGFVVPRCEDQRLEVLRAVERVLRAGERVQMLLYC